MLDRAIVFLTDDSETKNGADTEHLGAYLYFLFNFCIIIYSIGFEVEGWGIRSKLANK